MTEEERAKLEHALNQAKYMVETLMKLVEMLDNFSQLFNEENNVPTVGGGEI